jgi:hypothetical protein
LYQKVRIGEQSDCQDHTYDERQEYFDRLAAIGKSACQLKTQNRKSADEVNSLPPVARVHIWLTDQDKNEQ